MKFKKLFFTIVLFHIGSLVFSQNTSYNIRLNQVGFLSNSKKIGALINTESDSFSVATSDLSSVVYRGQCLPAANYSASGENVSIADFTLVTTPGKYVLIVDDLGKSVPFTINDDAFENLSKASIKAFYYNRASMEITSTYAGKYARAMGHPDTAVVVLPSAASANRPAGTIISTPGGWYDAGDYNKYIVNSGISTFTLLSAYETYPEYFDTLNVNIPESDNQIPDILDEALWNIRWMMTMQDSTDGGVYNKTTEAQFSGFLMPSKVTSTRYVTAKSTAATLDFAAIMAMTARIYKKYDPELANQALIQAEKAWQWAKANPKISFNNPAASGKYPAIGTGGYGDSDFSDEFSWCAAELYITTKNDSYYSSINVNGSYGLPGWGSVKTLGLQSLIVHKDSLTAIADTTLMKNKFMDMVTGSKNAIVNSPYRIPGDFFYWGGNNAYANWGMLYMQAFRLSKNATYFNAAVSALDYLLGRNATTYCFVTGAGTKRPMDIHHRISNADGIAEPIPGLLVGGSNPSDITDCGASRYPSSLPAKSYADLSCSYSTNEVAINWNAPLAFLAGAIQCEYINNFTDTMPFYFSVSTSKINLPSKAGKSFPVVFEGNINWTLTASADWIGINTTKGSGSAVIQVFSNTDNKTESAKTGKIYIYEQEKLIDSIAVTQNAMAKEFRIECEEYTGMSGLQTESTTDIGGGLNIGYVDMNDWATYNLDISYPGVYDVTFRHAGYAGDFDLSLNDTLLTTIKFAATADWQVWASYSTQLNLTEGEKVLKLDFNKDGTNLNWMDFKWVKALKVGNMSANQAMTIYPVPTDNQLNILFSEANIVKEIQIISLDGRVLTKTKCEGTTRLSIDVSGFEKGIYILKANSNNNVFTKEIVIQ